MTTEEECRRRCIIDPDNCSCLTNAPTNATPEERQRLALGQEIAISWGLTPEAACGTGPVACLCHEAAERLLRLFNFAAK